MGKLHRHEENITTGGKVGLQSLNIIPITGSYRLKQILTLLFENSKGLRVLVLVEFLFVILDGFIVSRVPLVVKHYVDGISTMDIAVFIQEKLLIGVIFSLTVAFGWLLCAIIQHYLREKISTSLMINVQYNFYSHIQNLSLEFYQSTYVGEIASRLTNDIYLSVKETYETMGSMIWVLSMITSSLITIALFDIRFFAIFIVLLAVTGLASRYLYPIIRHLQRDIQDQTGVINSKITENIYSISLIKSFAKESHSLRQLEGSLKEYLNRTLRTAKARVFINDSLVFMASQLIPFSILAITTLLRFEIGKIIAFYTFWTLVSSRLTRIMQNVNRLMISFTSFDRILEFYKISPLVKDNEGAIELDQIDGRIRFEHVSFSYPSSEKRALTDVSFTIDENERIAIFGRSGSGKTTVINLLLRFFNVSEGNVYIDDSNITDMKQSNLRKHIGIVMQDVLLINGSIRHNMLFAKEDAQDEEIVEALKKAEAWEFVQELTDGIHTVVGERGAKLSGGQRQRLSIARVFLKNPKLLLFDEATSALDSVTEDKILSSMEKVFEDRTSIIITHKLSTIKNCDRIIFMDNGRIIEIGTHDELKVQCEKYGEVCLRQTV